MPAALIDQLFRLDGQVAIVTGGLGRLGTQYARALTSAGAAVASFDLRSEPSDLMRALLADRLPISMHRVDLVDRAVVARAFDEVVRTLGTPTVLINNAGQGSPPDAPVAENGPFEDYPQSSWDAMIHSHLTSTFVVSQEFIKRFRAARRETAGAPVSGSIINISSTYGLVTPDQSVYEYRRRDAVEYYKPVGYSVAKSGVLNFTRWLAEYCAPFGVRVNTLVPGGVRDRRHAPEFVREYERRTPLGRMASEEDFNGAILFLASCASAYMTGAMLVIDGGWTAR